MPASPEAKKFKGATGGCFPDRNDTNEPQGTASANGVLTDHADGCSKPCQKVDSETMEEKSSTENNSDTLPGPEPGTCNFYLKRKQRYCRTRPDYNGKFCVPHESQRRDSDAVTKMENTDVPAKQTSHEEIITSTKAEESTDKVFMSKKTQKYTNHANIPEPQPDRCQFYLERKKRHCRTRPDFDGKFCVEHGYLVSADAKEHKKEKQTKRIPCPLDPNHSVYENRMKHHLNICNMVKLKQNMPRYCVKNVNLSENTAESQERKVSIRDISDTEVLQLVESVRRLHAEHVGILDTEVLLHEVLEEEIEKPANGLPAQKHLQQQASIIGHLRKEGLLCDNHTYVEFGAGKGGLSHWVQLAVKDAKHNQYILIDKGSVRYKMDNFHKGEHQGPTFQRIKIDIQDLVLSRLESIENDDRPIIGLGKHLCGGATDLMLRCLKSCCDKSTNTSSARHNVSGLALALCCHHRCSWQTYVGKDFFDACGLGPREFSLITTMTSWATCGTIPFGKSANSELDDSTEHLEEEEKDGSGESGYYHPRYGTMLPEERELVGRQCKQLIDKGRQRFLESLGFQSRTLCYVDKKHTLENMMLLATRPDFSAR